MWIFLICLLSISSILSATNKVQVVEVSDQTNCKRRIEKNDWIAVHYIAHEIQNDMREIQNTYIVGIPISVQLTEKEVIPGWIDGLVGLCENSAVTLIVPDKLAYASGSDIRFNIEISQVSKEEIPEPSLFDKIDENKDGQISLVEFENHFKTRPRDLGPGKKPPVGLFHKEDINQNYHLNWEEFGGPKGTAPPAAAAKIIEKEKNDPELAKFKKGDVRQVKIDPTRVKLHKDEPVKKVEKEEIDELDEL